MSTTDKPLPSKILPPRDDYFMGLTLMAAAACADPVMQQAALITDGKDRWISIGINLLCAADYSAEKFTWSNADRELAMITAGESAIGRALKLYVPGSTSCEPFVSHTMYMAGTPSLRCVRMCAGHGLKEIIYGPLRPESFDEDEWKKIQGIAKRFGVKLTEFNGNLNWMRDRLLSLANAF